MNYDTVIFGHGGIKGIILLGAYSYIENMYKINRYIGVSVGAIIACLVCIGYTCEEIKDVFIKTEDFISLVDIKQFTDKLGIISNKKIKEILHKLIAYKFSVIPTFRMIKEILNKELMIVSFNLSKEETVYFDHISSPDLEILDAVLLSINIPFIFEKLKYKDDIYIDGAYGDPYPCYKNAIALSIHSENLNEDMFSYIIKILTCSINQAVKKSIKSCKFNMMHVNIKTPYVFPVGNLSVDKKIEMYNHGVNFMKSFLNKNSELK